MKRAILTLAAIGLTALATGCMGGGYGAPMGSYPAQTGYAQPAYAPAMGYGGAPAMASGGPGCGCY